MTAPALTRPHTVALSAREFAEQWLSKQTKPCARCGHSAWSHFLDCRATWMEDDDRMVCICPWYVTEWRW